MLIRKGKNTMDQNLLNALAVITDEEKAFLNGNNRIDKSLYMTGDDNTIDSQKLIEKGKLIQIRPHTRFVHFPLHKHNYVEVIYMCSGSTHHRINGDNVILSTGELLFLSKNAEHEIYPAAKDDIAVNFVILPEFFDVSLGMLGNEDNNLRRFIVDSLTGKSDGPLYLHFKVADTLPIQNLIENLVWSIKNHQTNNRSINQTTMGLLFLNLLNCLSEVELPKDNASSNLILFVYQYIEENYKSGELRELAALKHYDVFWLSKEIKKQTGFTYSELIQQKRINQACYLLTNTPMNVNDIANAVGYENISYFHRLFKKALNMSPYEYRKRN